MDKILRTCFVTGASGEIGRKILPGLAKRGWRIRVLEHHSPVPKGEWEIVHGDLLSFNGSWLDRVDVVLHLAARGNSRASDDQRSAGNEMATRALVHALKKHHQIRLLFASSIDVYDPRNNLTGLHSENSLGPITANGHSKVKAEKSVREHPSYTIVRLPMVIGNDDRHSKRFLRLASLHFFPVTSRKFSAIDIRDAANLFIHLAQSSENDNAIFTVSDNHVYSWPQVAAYYGTASGFRVWRPIVPVALVSPMLFQILGNRDGAQYFRYNWFCRPNFPPGFTPQYEAFPGAVS